MLGDKETTRRADREAEAYNDDQMLAGVTRAAQSWKRRVIAAGREAIFFDSETRTAILVLDFGEIAELRAALDATSDEFWVGASVIGSALHDEFEAWLTTSEPIETPADPTG